MRKDQSLKKVSDLLTKAGVEHWIDSGTLLGAIRNKDFIPHDRDIDISIYGKDERKAVIALGKLSGAHIPGKQILFTKPNLDVHIKHKNDPVYEWTIGKVLKRIHKRHYDNLDVITFAGGRYNIPSEPEIYLDIRYGHDWKEVNKDYDSYKDDGAIVQHLDEKIVYTAGTWDLLHRGHLNLLEAAKGMGERLIVGVSTDKLVESYKPKTVIPFKDRIRLVQALKCVDVAIPQTDLNKASILRRIGADILVMGDDWVGKHTYKNVRTVYLPYTKGISTTWLKEQLSHQPLKRKQQRKSA